MWILFKLFASMVAFFARFASGTFSFRSEGRENTVIDGIIVFKRLLKNKGRVNGTRFGIELKCPAVFKFTQEGALDRFFKSLGFVTEFQTGDSQFDRHIYIASDSSALKYTLRDDPKAREIVHHLFQKNCRSITCDGKVLWLHFPGDLSHDTALMSLCVELYRQLSGLEQKWKGFFQDPFAWKILLVESFVWSLAIYAFTGFLEWNLFKESVHLAPYAVMKQGLATGMFGALLLSAFLVLFLKESSRGHRILIESFLLLAIGFPLGGISALSDINTHLDRSEPVSITAKVTDLYQREHRGRRGRRWYSYHIQVKPAGSTEGIDLPQQIQITHTLYLSLAKEGIVRIQIGKGRLRHAWFRSIQPQPSGPSEASGSQ